MKKNIKLTERDFTNLMRIAYLTKKINRYGKSLHLNQDDLDCIYNICNGYLKLIERVTNE